METANRKLSRLATTDPLAGVSNRRKFYHQAESECQRSARFGSPLSVIALDLDKFKSINDQLGHAVGDRVLVSIARCLKKEVRDSDLVGRMGGEEFAVLLPETPLVAAAALAERLLARISAVRIETDRQTVQVTASIGVAEYQRGEDDFQKMLARADALLYEAKHGGRNQVRVSNGLRLAAGS